MAYERQVQEHLNRFDVSLNKLYMLIKRGQQAEALRFMEEGELKDRYDELQNIITVSRTNNMGVRGVPNTGAL